jgi:hypothetical protein
MPLLKNQALPTIPRGVFSIGAADCRETRSGIGERKGPEAGADDSDDWGKHIFDWA